MIIMRHRSDLNQKEIVSELRQAGHSVIVISTSCKIDLIVGAFGKNYLFEVKQGGEPLRPKQVEFIRLFNGKIEKISTTEEAIAIINGDNLSR